MKPLTNKEIAKLFRDIAAAYLVKGGNNFKIIAYNQAADSIEQATSELKELWEDKQLDSVPGLGKSIQGHLDELFKTGKVKHFEEIKKDIPPAMFDLLNIVGIGPKTAYKLTKAIDIKSIEDLIKAAKKGKIKILPGFGEKSEQDILTSATGYTDQSARQVLPFAYATAQRVIAYMKTSPYCEKIETLGSLRRMVSTVGDVDIGVASERPDKVMEHFKAFRETARVLGAGSMASSIVLNNGIQVDLKIQPAAAFGALLQHFTGSKYHNIKLRELSLKKGMSLSEHGIKHEGKLVKFADEKSYYNFIGLDYIEPELREDSGEIEAAITHKLPTLIKIEDIKGDLHLHSSYPIEPSHDLGKDDFKTLISKGIQLKYQYIGLSDHSPGVSSHTNTQILNLIKKRTDVIEQEKYSNKNIRILNLLEVDILTNGEISVPQKGLEMLDFAIAGIHSSHNQDKKTITKRLLSATNNPKIKVISHPTGRLLLERESYEVDWDEVFKACARTNTFLEINSWPIRLDLPDTLVRQAKTLGVKFVINTDAHAVIHMDNMYFGVSVARRGWATKKDIVNSKSWLEFSKEFGVS
jgi:DNA polymerase (family 10)